MKSSAASNKISAQSGLGKPKIPEEMAGIETDTHFKLLAFFKVLEMQL